MKIIDKTLVAANQNNILYFFDKFSGDIIKLFPTEKTLVNNVFKNNLSSNEQNTFFLNTYGSLYAVDNKNLKINWFVNLNQSTNLNPSTYFLKSNSKRSKQNCCLFKSIYFYYRY